MDIDKPGGNHVADSIEGQRRLSCTQVTNRDDLIALDPHIGLAPDGTGPIDHETANDNRIKHDELPLSRVDHHASW